MEFFSPEHPFNDIPKIMITADKLMIDNTFFILQIYETYRAFAQNGGVALWFEVLSEFDFISAFG